jgi:predicted DNA-binding transcriptional regulator YafY
MVVFVWQMPRASDAQRAKRLNLARTLLRQQPRLSGAVQQLAKTCSISRRQAYRYIQQAQHLTGPVPVNDPKVAFTVKLSRALAGRIRTYATAADLSLSESVSRALTAMLNRGRRRG